jgi:hypothetical protein
MVGRQIDFFDRPTLASLLVTPLKAACSFSFSKAALSFSNLRLFSAYTPSEEHPKWSGSGWVLR